MIDLFVYLLIFTVWGVFGLAFGFFQYEDKDDEITMIDVMAWAYAWPIMYIRKKQNERKLNEQIR